MEKQFDESRAQKFHGVGRKLAVPNAEGTIYDKPSWGKGAKQHFEGPHVTIFIPLFNEDGSSTGFDVYGCETQKFFETHTLVGDTGFPGVGVYIKTGADPVEVWAYQLTENDSGGATIFEGRDETTDYTAPAGHWRVRNPGGEVYDINPLQFAYLYQAAD